MKHLLPQVDLPFTVLISGAAFLVLFFLIIALVYSKGRKKSYEETKMLPLEDGITGDETSSAEPEERGKQHG